MTFIGPEMTCAFTSLFAPVIFTEPLADDASTRSAGRSMRIRTRGSGSLNVALHVGNLECCPMRC